jgi:phosphoglycolate phosphatase-like HAD superfamily hydrolase
MIYCHTGGDIKRNMNIIFDIDGTLVDSYEMDAGLYRDTVADILGDIRTHDKWSKYKHVTDIGILEEICFLNNISNVREVISKVRQSFGERLQNYIACHPCKPIPGAVDFIDTLKRSPDYQVGIATGGWRHTSQMKLKSAGFDIKGIALKSCDDHKEREMIMEACYKQISKNGDGALYFGDHLWDLKASEILGWKFIGIGDNLKNKCDNWYPDFTNIEINKIIP